MMPMAKPALPLVDMPLEVAASAIAVAEAVVDERDLVAVAVLETEIYERRVDDETVTAMEVGRAEAEAEASDDESTTATASALLLVVGGR